MRDGLLALVFLVSIWLASSLAFAQPAENLKVVAPTACNELSTDGCLCVDEGWLRDTTARALAYDALVEHPIECPAAASWTAAVAALIAVVLGIYK